MRASSLTALAAVAALFATPTHAQPAGEEQPGPRMEQGFAAPSDGGAPAVDELAPPSQPPSQAPPAPQSATPPPPPAQAAPAPSAPAGQWVYTQQYGWIWMPYGDAYTWAPPDSYGQPYQYVYYPDYGWTWVIAPWVWGWGPWPYFGVYGPGFFAWYQWGWWRYPRFWHFSPGFRGPFPAFRTPPVRPPAVRTAPAPAMRGAAAAPRGGSVARGSGGGAHRR
jgi:hypothetical protein